VSRRKTSAVLVLTVCAVAVTVRRRVHHLVVAGHSMEPTFEPGDRVVAVRVRNRPRPGDLAITGDPRKPDRLLIKRVYALRDGMVDLRGDHAAASTDSRTFGMVPPAAVDACVVFRYHPPERAGRVSASRARARRPRCRLADPR
jgi:nickel-type superoxide dismutase maturation protease